MVSRNREAWLAAVGAEGLGRDPEIEAVLDEAREQATARIIEVLGLGPAAQAPPEMHAVLRAYGGMAEAATREWLERDRWNREQCASLSQGGAAETGRDRPTRRSQREQDETSSNATHEETTKP